MIAPFIEEGTPAHLALRRYAGRHRARLPENMSEAAMLRVLLHAGAEALSDQVLDAGYAELAATFNSGEQASERRTARDRYASRNERDA